MGHISANQPSLDHLVGQGKHARGNGDAECLRGFQIDDQRELARRLDREIAGAGAA